MATRTQTQQTSVPKQQAQRQPAPQQAQAPVERTSNGERGLNRLLNSRA